MIYQLKDLSYQKSAFEPDLMLKNLKKELKFNISVGIWYFTPSGGRFHERYIDNATIEEKIDMAAGMAELGVTGIEAHYPAEVNEKNTHLYKQLEKETGIRLVAVPFSHFFDKIFEFGSLSNPNKESRKKAIEIAIGGLKLIQDMGADMAISWPGMDGYRYLHGKPYMYMWDQFESAMAEAMDAVPGVRVAIEPKGYEPAINNIYRTTAEGILAAQRIERKLQNPENRKLVDSGTALATLNPEVGHVKMSYEMLPAAFSLIAMDGRLAHTHWNSQPDGNYDQDNNIGLVNFPEAEALLYSLWAIGYNGYYGIDVNPENMPVHKAIEINVQALLKLRERIARLPHEDIMECHLLPEKNRGTLEQILIANW